LASKTRGNVAFPHRRNYGFKRILERTNQVMALPAEVHDTEAHQGYDVSQRAYIFKSTGEKCEFTLEPTNSLINPVFILNGWKDMAIRIKVDNEDLSPNVFEYSWHEDKLIIWTDIAVRKTTTITVTS